MLFGKAHWITEIRAMSEAATAQTVPVEANAGDQDSVEGEMEAIRGEPQRGFALEQHAMFFKGDGCHAKRRVMPGA